MTLYDEDGMLNEYHKELGNIEIALSELGTLIKGIMGFVVQIYGESGFDVDMQMFGKEELSIRELEEMTNNLFGFVEGKCVKLKEEITADIKEINDEWD